MCRAPSLRLEGFGESVAYRVGRLTPLLATFGDNAQRDRGRSIAKRCGAPIRDAEHHRRAARARDLAREPCALRGAGLRRFASARPRSPTASTGAADWCGWRPRRDGRGGRRPSAPRIPRGRGHATLMRAPRRASRSASTCSSRRPKLELRLSAGREGELRSGRRVQFRPHVRGRVRQTVQTQFSAEALADPHTRELEGILRSCVHCGFCTATCPTYVTLRRRARQPARAHLSDQGPAGDRPQDRGRGRLADRPLPVLPLLRDDLPLRRRLSPADRSRAGRDRGDLSRARLPIGLMRASAGAGIALANAASASALGLAAIGRCSAGARAACPASARGSSAMLALAPHRFRRRGRRRTPGVFAPRVRRPSAPPDGAAWRLRAGVLAPQINEATIRLLNRAGIEVVIAKGEGCCGSLAHHMGHEKRGARAGARRHRRLDARDRGPGARGDRRHRLGLRLDDQGLWLHAARRSGLRRRKPTRVAALAKDVSEVAGALDLDLRGAAPRLLSPITPPARCSTGRRSSTRRGRCSSAPASTSARSPKRICAAARPGLTTSCSRRSPNALRDRKVAEHRPRRSRT